MEANELKPHNNFCVNCFINFVVYNRERIGRKLVHVGLYRSGEASYKSQQVIEMN